MDAVNKTMDIRSPIAGVVTDVYVRQGNVAVVGRDEHPLLQVADISKMVMNIPVTTNDIHYFKKGKKARVRVGDDVVEGTVTKVPMAASAASRLFNVEITFDNKKKILRPGMFVQAEVTLVSQNAISVETDAFVHRGDSLVLFKVADGVATAVGVRKGFGVGKYSAFEGSLVPGDLVVVDGTALLKNDVSKVKIVSGD
jgi:multidrug efflux pump subunit AcrA (membrane-fusion protein)